MKGQKKKYVIPVADPVINPAVDRIHHMRENRLQSLYGVFVPGQPLEQPLEHLGISPADEALSQRKGKAGIAFHNVAVIQDDKGRILLQSCDGADLKQKKCVVLPGIFQVAFGLKEGFDLLRHPDQLLDPGSGKERCIFGPLPVIDLVRQVVIISNRIRLV